MRSRKNIVITFISSIVILASCTSADINHSMENFTLEKNLQDINVRKYFSYKDFSLDAIHELDSYIQYSELKSNELSDLKKLRNNIKKIASKEEFILHMGKSDSYSLELIQLIYKIGLPIKIKWDQSEKKYMSQNLLSESMLGFCSSIYDDALQTIIKEISSTSNFTLLVYSQNFADSQELLTKQFPEIHSIFFNQGNPQKFAADALGINSSNKRFNKIINLNPNQKLEFSARPRSDIQKIFFLLEPAQFQSVLPAFRYHGGNKFQYINFISSLESLDNTNQLLDFENSFIPVSDRLSYEIKTKEILSLKSIMQRSILNDWLLIEIVKEAGIRSADINGMSGALEFQRNSCTKRSLPIHRINSDWATS